ncbi:MAG: ArgE/DapE family deacylase [Rhizobiales bacterium]|nr:ArgE/DapE family deacylase [Hyphomicrobiales bacterium]
MSLAPELHRQILAAIESRTEERERFLARLVQTPSSNPPGDSAPIAAVAAELLEALGFKVERHPVPDGLVRRFGMVSCTNLVVRRRFGDSASPGPVIALNAHGDVVPPGEGWTHPPFGAEVADGFMYGRGVAVSKSDLATYAFALLALEAVAEDLKGSVELHFTFDEEIGGYIGPKWLLDEGIVQPDYCISAGLSYSIVTAHNGCLHLQVTVHGKSAHAAAPETGHDALEAATAVLQALYGERASFPERVSEHPGIGHPNLTVGLISGGINTNVVPDKVVLRLDRRIIPEENPAAVEAHLRLMIAKIGGRSPGISIDVERVLLASPLQQLPGAEVLIEPLRAYGRELLGEDLKVEGVPLYTDARLYAEAGIPTVSYGAGPRSFLEANGHRADEKLRLADLHAATGIVALSIADILSR